MSNKIEIRRQLRLAVQKLDARGLQLSSKWACEQLVGMEPEESVDSEGVECYPSYYRECSDENVPTTELDTLLFAKSLLTNGEYQRCAHLFRRSNVPNSASIIDSSSRSASNNAVKSNLGLFLSVYSMYMAGEKLKEQQQATNNSNGGSMFPGMIGSSSALEKQNGESETKSGKGSVPNTKKRIIDSDEKKNPYLNELFAELEPLYYDNCLDGFLLYIFAVVVRDLVRQGQIIGQGGKYGLSLFPKNNESKNDLHHMKENNENIDVNGREGGLSSYNLFLESLRAYPWNWYVRYVRTLCCVLQTINSLLQLIQYI